MIRNHRLLFVRINLFFLIISGCIISLLHCSHHPSDSDSDGESDYYRVVSPESSSRMTTGTSFDIKWETIEDANVGDYVQIHLHKGDSRVYQIVDKTENDGNYRWNSVTSSMDSGSDYRIRIADFDDADNHYVYSKEFSIIKNSGGSTSKVSSPKADSTYHTGESIDIRWTTSAVPGSTVVIDLYRDTVKEFRLEFDYQVDNDGRQYWRIPTCLESDDNYRIRITSRQNSHETIFSAWFTVVGLEPDTFENDDSRDEADTSDNYLYQEHTLTDRDTDWVAVKLYEGTDYIVQVLGDCQTRTAMFAPGSSDTLLGLKPVDVGAFWTKYRDFTPDSTGIYFIMTRSVSRLAEYRGSYILSVIPFNDTGRLEIYAPGTDTVVEAGEKCSVKWDSSAVYGKYVSLTFYRDTFPLYQIHDSVTNYGDCSFTVPANLESASYYHIRVAACSTPAIFGMSNAFTVEGKNPDEFEDDDTRETAGEIVPDSLQTHSLYFYDRDWVTAELSEEKSYLIQVGGSYARMHLYREGSSEALDSVIAYRVGYQNAGYMLFTPEETGRYFVCISPNDDKTSNATYSLLLTTVDNSGTLNVTSPEKSDVWAAGSSYEIIWEPEKIIGYTVRLLLYEGDKCIMMIDTGTANSGSYTWKIEQTLPSGSDYTVRVQHRNEEMVFGISERFTISGMNPDDYEDDDTRENAQRIDVDNTQNRSLTYHDTDWVKITMDEGSIYTFQTGGDAETKGYLFFEESDSSLGSFVAKSDNNTGYLSYTCLQNGTHYLRITPNGNEAYRLGTYTLSLRTGVDNGVIRVTAPTADTVWEAGSRYTIKWNSADVGYGNVEIHLMQGAAGVLPVTTRATNNGTFTWSVPSGAPAGYDFYIRVRSDNSSDCFSIFGYSPKFTINGIVPDEFESDDDADDAKSIPVDSTIQSRTITTSDTDWCSFDVKENHLYLVTIHGIRSSSLTLYNATANSLLVKMEADTTDSTASVSWFAEADGTGLIRVGGGWGEYLLSVKEYDSAGYRFSLSSPKTGSSYTLGTSLTITWSGPLMESEPVDIFLFDQDGIVETIAADTPNVGMYDWTPSVSLAADDGYYIRIISRTNDKIAGESGGFGLVE